MKKPAPAKNPTKPEAPKSKPEPKPEATKSTNKIQPPKITPKVQPIKSNKVQLSKPVTKTKQLSFPNGTNQQFLKRSLRLIGINDQLYEKQTKSSLNSQIFPKSLPNPSNSKQFFYICITCVKALASVQQAGELAMWYPPRTVNQQIQFKKVLFGLLQKMQASGTVPKKLLLSKMVIMGESGAGTLLQFLRILAQIALRAVYIQKYSKDQRLIQLQINQGPYGFGQNDVNKFYAFPFCETVTNVEPPIQSQFQIDCLKKIYKTYIERYKKKILELRVSEETQLINPQRVMGQIMQQKQLSQTLSNKVNKAVYGQNRAFDRRVILQKNAQIWEELQGIQCNYIDNSQASVLRLEGQTAKLLKNWNVVSGTHNLIQFNSACRNLDHLKTKCQQKMTQLRELHKQIVKRMKV